MEARPASSGVKARPVGDTACPTLGNPRKPSITFDGDRLRNLRLFAGRPRPALPAPGRGVVVFGPGGHKPPGGAEMFSIASDTTVHRAHDAMRMGGLDISDGIVIGAANSGIRVAHSSNVTIDGPIVIDPGRRSFEYGQSNGVAIHGFKAFSRGAWTDGIDMTSCSDVRIDDILMCNSDDTIAFRAGRWKYSGVPGRAAARHRPRRRRSERSMRRTARSFPCRRCVVRRGAGQHPG